MPSRQHNRRHASLLSLVAVGSLFTCVTSAAISVPTTCAAKNGTTSPVCVTVDCVDELYSNPVIDATIEKSSPAPHTWVSGHFLNTTVSFNFYFPPANKYEGRFFQQAYPTQNPNITDVDLGFALDSKAYAIQVTGVQGYRAEAAAAKYSKIVARQQYKLSPEKRIYGFLYGGSGGSFQTVGAMENSVGVWDGAVAYVQAVPVSAPNGPTARAMAGLVLHSKKDDIQNALKPGGSGDPYATLNAFQKDMLREVTLMGMPIRTLLDFDTTTNRSTTFILAPVIKAYDPSYATDFWTKSGYLGTEKSPLADFLRSSLVEFNSTIGQVRRDSGNATIAIELTTRPDTPTPADVYGFDITVSGANGTSTLGQMRGFYNQTTSTVALTGVGVSNDALLLASLASGTNVQISNRFFIASHAYYRYQVPARAGFIGFDQFRGADGASIYPVRPVNVAQRLGESISGGGKHTGNFTGKMIIVQNLMDSDAWPYQADWYKSQVKSVMGDSYKNNYRLYYNDNADHGYFVEPGPREAIVIGYSGILQQAVRDVSSWVERKETPAASTNYKVTPDNGVVVPEKALKRLGIQPTIDLKVEGKSDCPKVKAGSVVKFEAEITTPPSGGKIVSTEWNFLGTGQGYTKVPFGKPEKKIEVKNSFKYTTPGRYIAVLRVNSQREGITNTTFAMVGNLARVCVNVV